MPGENDTPNSLDSIGSGSLSEHLQALIGSSGVDSRSEATLFSLAINAARSRLGSKNSKKTLAEWESIETAELPAGLLTAQQEWIKNATDNEARNYVPSLLNTWNPEIWLGQYGSTLPLVNAVRTVAAARLPQDIAHPRIYDPALGVGALALGVADGLERNHPISVDGQDINASSGILASCSLAMSGYEGSVHVGNSLIDDHFPETSYDICVSDAPYGIEWKAFSREVQRRHDSDGWYAAGMPAVSDASWLFISRLLEKLKSPETGGGIAIAVVNRQALVAQAGSKIRSRILATDLLDSIVSLPGGLAAHTGIPLYLLVFANNKPQSRRGRVQIIDLKQFSRQRQIRTKHRTLDVDAYSELDRALRSSKGSPISRSIPSENFRFTTLSVCRRSPVGSPNWSVRVRANENLETFPADRYGPVPVAAEATDSLSTQFDIDQYFDGFQRTIRKWLQELEWQTTRLSAALIEPPSYIRIGSGPREQDRATFHLPLNSKSDAFMSLADSAISESPLVELKIDTSIIQPIFLCAWLNTDMGRAARDRAVADSSIGRAALHPPRDAAGLMRLADSLIIPIPEIQLQSEIANANSHLTAAKALIDTSVEQIWANPTSIRESLSRVDPIFDKSLRRWAADLPYPIASAIWTLETLEHDTRASHDQIFRVWEAYAAFAGTILLSALRQDPALAGTELPALRRVLQEKGAGMTHASLGGWKIIVERISSIYRTRLNGSDLGERAEAVAAFSGIPRQSIMKVIDVKVIRLLDQAIQKRNSWLGHAGTTTDDEREAQLVEMRSILAELQGALGASWNDFRCVRAGGIEQIKGQMFQDVELLKGLETPFKVERIQVAAPMDKGGLYIVGSESARPLLLEPTMILHSSPGKVRTTCYFYNRTEASGIRMVTYQLSEHSEVVEKNVELSALISDLSD